MNWQEWVGFALALGVMMIGLIGSVLPGLPGAPLLLLAAIAHRLYFGPASASNLVLLILVVITLVSLLLDYLAGVLGARKMGATWRGILGAMLGALIGMFFAPFGIIVGSFAGALALEWIGGREFEEAVRAGAGAVFGLVLGAIGKLGCGVAMMGLFAVDVIRRSTLA